MMALSRIPKSCLADPSRNAGLMRNISWILRDDISELLTAPTLIAASAVPAMTVPLRTAIAVSAPDSTTPASAAASSATASSAAATSAAAEPTTYDGIAAAVSGAATALKQLSKFTARVAKVLRLHAKHSPLHDLQAVVDVAWESSASALSNATNQL